MLAPVEGVDQLLAAAGAGEWTEAPLLMAISGRGGVPYAEAAPWDAAGRRAARPSGGHVVRVRIDLHRCIGASTCMFVAPTAFRWRRGEGKAEVIRGAAVEEELLREAALACPTQAILLDEVDPSAADGEPTVPA